MMYLSPFYVYRLCAICSFHFKLFLFICVFSVNCLSFLLLRMCNWHLLSTFYLFDFNLYYYYKYCNLCVVWLCCSYLLCILLLNRLRYIFYLYSCLYFIFPLILVYMDFLCNCVFVYVCLRMLLKKRMRCFTGIQYSALPVVVLIQRSICLYVSFV